VGGGVVRRRGNRGVASTTGYRRAGSEGQRDGEDEKERRRRDARVHTIGHEPFFYSAPKA
jgi:hypothetical protein